MRTIVDEPCKPGAARLHQRPTKFTFIFSFHSSELNIRVLTFESLHRWRVLTALIDRRPADLHPCELIASQQTWSRPLNDDHRRSAVRGTMVDDVGDKLTQHENQLPSVRSQFDVTNCGTKFVREFRGLGRHARTSLQISSSMSVVAEAVPRFVLTVSPKY